MKQVETLLIISQNPQVLLGLKNPEKKFGGKWNGWGGKVELGESIEEGLLREIEEESGVKIKKPEKFGEILFKFEIEEEPDHEVHIFRAENYNGELKPSDDFLKYDWFHFEKLPDEMMPADKKWIPFLVQGKKFKGEIYFDKKMQNPKINIYEVESL
ncbi:NUDIX domain-containing protein [Candidatus Pacearchaeota archaeon]|nr:NUDIX domain-containing protein [Candidatus Pacearchaeota archaeon]